MDLMRTLLIYMTATMTLAVQNTAAPKETPVPTPAPGAVVETVDMPGQDGDTITAVPPEQAVSLADITPLPVPLITPNNKAYHNLAMGAKGKEVRKLQEKLVELGYLPEGAVDGAYGRQTYNAIKKFQRYNGLTADGIAGRKTQTNLFENPDIAPNPEVKAAPEVTPAPETTPAPVATPVPEEISAPEEAAEAEEPEAEEPEAEEPEAEESEAPEAEAAEEPETAEPEAEAAEEPEAGEPAAETAEAPETEAPAAETADSEGEPDVVENVDLDADVYEPITAMIALNESNGPLEYIVTQDGVPVTARPRLSRNGDRIRVSLDDMCAAVEKWQLTDDNVGTVVLEAAGYTLVLYNEDTGSSATLDGKEIPMKEDDFDFSTDGHFINVEFLASALKGEALWDEEENTLMLRIRDREAVESAD